MSQGWAYPDADEFMVREQKADGTYQGSHYRLAMEYVTDRSLAIDGGAHVGTWSKLMSADFAHVIAVEPSADTFEALVFNMPAQGCENVDVRNIAIGTSVGAVEMVLDGRGAEMKNTGARHVGVKPGGSVRCEPIDAWELPSLGFLKLDIEGSELFALQGAKATLKRCKPIVLFENKWLWKRYGLPREAPQRFLEALGYRQLAVASMDLIWGPR